MNETISNLEAYPFKIDRLNVSGLIDEVVALRARSLVKQPLSRVLYELNRQQVSYSKRGSYLDGSRLATVVCGNNRVFRQEMIT